MSAVVDFSPSDRRFYPELGAFMTALQDEGKEDSKFDDGRITYPKIKAVCGKVYDQMKKHSFPNLVANRSRAAHSFMIIVCAARKHVDLCIVAPEFHKYSTNGEKVYIVANNVESFGWDLILRDIIRDFAANALKKTHARDPGDAIRVAAVMLDPQHQGTVTGILRGIKDRAKSDQSVDPTIAWAHQAIKQFQDPQFEVLVPNDINMEDIENVNPNDEDRITQPGRDAKWFLDTWRHYLKRKYKEAIHQWDKETGRGAHEPYEFSNFCDKGNKKWLVWVYLMDLDQNFLLYCNAIGRPPVHVGRESGFDDDAQWNASDSNQDDNIALTGTVSDLSSPTSTDCHGSGRKRKKSSDDKQQSFIERTGHLQTLLTDVSAALKRTTQPVVVGDDIKGAAMLQTIIELGETKKRLEEASATMDPTTRNVVLHGITKQIDKAGEEYRRHVFAADEVEE